MDPVAELNRRLTALGWPQSAWTPQVQAVVSHVLRTAGTADPAAKEAARKGALTLVNAIDGRSLPSGQELRMTLVAWVNESFQNRGMTGGGSGGVYLHNKDGSTTVINSTEFNPLMAIAASLGGGQLSPEAKASLSVKLIPADPPPPAVAPPDAPVVTKGVTVASPKTLDKDTKGGLTTYKKADPEMDMAAVRAALPTPPPSVEEALGQAVDVFMQPSTMQFTVSPVPLKSTSQRTVLAPAPASSPPSWLVPAALAGVVLLVVVLK